MVLLALWHVNSNLASLDINIKLISHCFDMAEKVTTHKEILKL